MRQSILQTRWFVRFLNIPAPSLFNGTSQILNAALKALTRHWNSFSPHCILDIHDTEDNEEQKLIGRENVEPQNVKIPPNTWCL